MNVTKSASSPNVYKNSSDAISSTNQGSHLNDGDGIKSRSVERGNPTPATTSPTTARKGLFSRERSAGYSSESKPRPIGGGYVIDKLKSQFSGLNRPSSVPQNKEIAGTLTVAKIDQTAIVDCEMLFVDCDSFLQQAKETVELYKQSNEPDSKLKRFLLASKITRWRAKQKGNKLFTFYEQIIQRSEADEKALKAYIEKLLNDSSSLMLQALHLKSRLTSCINYNREEALRLRPIMEETKEYLRKFTAEKHRVLEMLQFYDEITDLKLAQKDNFIPWALRNANSASHPVLLSAATLNRDGIEKRFLKLMKVIDIIELIIQHQIPLYQSKKTNLEACTKSLHTMENILLNINAYRTFMKNTDEETLRNTSSRLTTHSDDHDITLITGEGHDQFLAEVRKGNHKALDDEDEEEEEEDDEEEEGFVSNMRVVSRPPQSTVIDENQKKPAAVIIEEEAFPGKKEEVMNAETSIPKSDENMSHQKSDEKRPAEKEVVRITKTANGVRRPSTLEDLIAEANKTSKAIDDALFANVTIEPYDHTNCSDCSFVFSMANDCSMHLAALQHTAQETTIRLQKLLELRERIKKRAQVLEGIDWGGES